MPLLSAYLLPHPPIMIPEVGRGREKEIQPTLDALQTVAREIVDLRPDALVIVSPHAPTYRDYYYVAPPDPVRGSFSDFGAPHPVLSCKGDADLSRAIVAEAQEAGLPCGSAGTHAGTLDHGSLIPLYWISRAWAGTDAGRQVNRADEWACPFPVVRLSYSGLDAGSHDSYGRAIARAIRESGKRVVFIASGDLSHRLKEDGPYGYHPKGPEFDRVVTEAIRTNDIGKFSTLKPRLCEQAAECGANSLRILAGVLAALYPSSELLSYEDTFGVGYAVGAFRPHTQDPAVRLAMYALGNWLAEGTEMELTEEEEATLPADLTGRRAGCFVSLHLDGELRGCIGTLGPTTDYVADEIRQNSLSAGLRDPRFPPVRREEFYRLTCSVDILGPLERIESPADLDVKRFGAVVSSGYRRGLLLPDLEGVDTVEQQIEIARAKAGIGQDEPVELERFEVVRHE